MATTTQNGISSNLAHSVVGAIVALFLMHTLPVTRGQTVDRSFFPITKAKLSLMERAAELNYQIYDYSDPANYDPAANFLPPATLPENAIVLRDPGSFLFPSVDKMAIVEEEEYCWFIWRGTEDGNLDWLQNLNVLPRSMKNGQCSVTEGLYRAYAGLGSILNTFAEPVFLPTIQNAITNNCANKQLIFTGHSQGAGAAVIATIQWSSRSPITISFAGPAVDVISEETCFSDVDAESIWRVVNTENKQGTIFYDPIVPSNPFGTHVGGYIQLPPGDARGEVLSPDQINVAGFSVENPVPHWSDSNQDLINREVHFIETHITKIRYLNQQVTDVLASDGFVDGTKCLIDTECRSFNLGLVGGCASNGECFGGFVDVEDPLPTAAPTGVPTAAPTSNPTSPPTNAPTGAPTTTPTFVPTMGPTGMPVISNPTEISVTNGSSRSPPINDSKRSDFERINAEEPTPSGGNVAGRVFVWAQMVLALLYVAIYH